MAIIKTQDFERLLVHTVSTRFGGTTTRILDLDMLLQCLDESERIQVLHHVLRIFLQTTKQQILSQIKTEHDARVFWEHVKSKCLEFSQGHAQWTRYPPSISEMCPYKDRQGMLVAMHLGLVHVVPSSK